MLVSRVEERCGPDQEQQLMAASAITTNRAPRFAGAGQTRLPATPNEVDQGRTWRQAKLDPPPSRWAWRMWSLTVDVVTGPLTVMARAWDDTGAVQPEFTASLWNPRGYGNNAYARIGLTVM